MTSTLNVETSYNADGLISQEFFAVTDNIRQTIHRQLLDTGEEQVRQALIALGWTPPPTDA